MTRLAHIWRRKPATSASQFESTLERVRDIREQSAWESATNPSSIQQRADRLAEARAHIKIPPLGSERHTRELARPDFLRWIIFSIGGVMALGLAFSIATSERTTKERIRRASIVFPAGAHTNMTERVADRFARRALALAEMDSSEWYQTRRYTKDGHVIMTFQYPHHPSTVLKVTVRLEPHNQRIVCTIGPQ